MTAAVAWAAPNWKERNRERAARAQAAITAYKAAWKRDVGGDDEADDKQAVSDLLADLMHLAEQERDFDFNRCHALAQDHYRAERKGDG